MKELFSNLAHLMNYRRKVDGEAFSELMAKILAPFPELGWELGPSLEDTEIDQLSLSVRNAPKFMELLATFDGVPIRGADWIIDIGIPPRDWEMYFEFMIGERLLEIEGSEWFWRMEDNDESCGLTLGAPVEQSSGLKSEELTEIADVILVGELGEINLLKFIESISVERIHTGSPQWLPMLTLRTHFASRYPSCKYAGFLAGTRHIAS